MSEFDEPAPKKKSSWLVTCGILAAVLGLGLAAVVGIGGYYAYTILYGPHDQEGVAGLLSVVNDTPATARATCSATDGEGWSVEKEIPAGETAQIEIGHRPGTCTIAYGASVATWAIKDPPAPDETWTVSLAEPAAEPAAIAVDAVGAPVDPVPAEPPPAEVAPVEPAAPVVAPAAPSPAPASTSSTRSTSRSTSSSGTSRTSTSTSTTTAPTTSTTTPSSGTGGTSRTATAAPVEEPSAEDDGGVLTAIKVEWAKGAKKSTPYTLTVDGKKVGSVPTKSLVASGSHKVKLTATGADPVECTVSASGGEDIVFAFDPANPKCPK
jgi:hypothetical protein